MTIYEGTTTFGPSAAGPYCGNNTLPPTYTSTGYMVAVQFFSDFIVNDAGFEATYSCIEDPTQGPTTTSTTSTQTTCANCTTIFTVQPPPEECGKNLLKIILYISVVFSKNLPTLCHD